MITWLIISLFVIPLYTLLLLYGFPLLVGWLLRKIQKAFGRVTPKYTYLQARVFVFVWLVMALYLLFVSIGGIHEVYQVPYTGQMSRTLMKQFAGSVIQLIAVLLGSIPMFTTTKDDVITFSSQNYFSYLYTPYNKLSPEKTKEFE
tara:strand:+ start:69 stop:506 length:438 start_codon:yes stop_codon:yes gene_type:complete